MILSVVNHKAGFDERLSATQPMEVWEIRVQDLVYTLENSCKLQKRPLVE